MKKAKRVLAIITVILLAGLYISTLIFALIGSENAFAWFKVSIYCSIVLPVLIWIYTFIYRMLKGSDNEPSDEIKKDKQQ